MAAAFQSDAFQGDAFESSTYTLTCEPGTLTLTGQLALLESTGTSILAADPGTLTLTGQSVDLIVGYVLTCNPGTLSLTAQDANLYSGYYLTANAGTLSLTAQSAGLVYGRKLTLNPGTLTLTPQLADLSAQIDQVFTCGVIIDLLPAEITGNYRNYSETLTVDSSEIPIKSWTLEESEQSLNASLNIELARLSDRSSILRDSDIDFSISINGTSETLLSNGNLKRKDYSISRQGIGPDDRVTFTALPDMEARLNRVPETTLILYDSLRHNLSADDFEGVYDKENNYTPPELMAFPNMTLQDIFEEVIITRCGFTDYVTDIKEDTKIPIVEFQAGQSYMNGLAGLIGMYEPEFIPFGGTYLEIKDGTAGVPNGSPTPREITVSHARNIGVASDISRVDGLLIHVSQERLIYDYYNDRTEVTQEFEGTEGGFPTTTFTVTVTTTYRDYFRDEHPLRPIHTEIVQEQRSTVHAPSAVVVHSSTENFFFDDFGRARGRNKTVNAYTPTPGTFVLGLNQVLYETETLTYKKHPYQPRTYYVKYREINSDGRIFIDGENQQLGEDYARYVMDCFRAGNVIDTMSSDWAKIATFKEQITPLRNNYLRIRRTEIDWLTRPEPTKHEDRNELRQGEVGVNIFINEQRKIYLTDAGTIEGTVESVNMGDLDLDTAIALGERIRRNRNTLPNRVSFDLCYIDNSLQKGTAFTAIGRSGENLGIYIIEARTLYGSQELYGMTIQARQAD